MTGSPSLRSAAASALRLTLLAALPLACALPAAAQPSPRDGMLVTTAWLADHLQDPNLVLLHVGEKPEYDAGHIPGARYITLRDISTPPDPDALPLELPAPAELRTRLEGFGISDDSRIVVYFGNDWVSPTTRVVFTLDWLGLGDRTAVLDGGMPAWKAEGRPLTAEVPPAKQGSLAARPVKDLVVTADWLQKNLRTPGIAVVDARDGVFYDGVRAGHGDVKGHIPGAGSLTFSLVFNDEMRMSTPAELQAMLDKAGVDKGETVVVYCHIGQQATAVIFAARSLGYDAKLYDGSFHDWGMRGLPTELPKGR